MAFFVTRKVLLTPRYEFSQLFRAGHKTSVRGIICVVNFGFYARKMSIARTGPFIGLSEFDGIETWIHVDERLRFIKVI